MLIVSRTYLYTSSCSAVMPSDTWSLNFSAQSVRRRPCFAGRCKRQKADALIEGGSFAQHEAAAFQLIDDTYKAGFFDGHFLREAGLRNFAAAFDMVKSKPLVSRNAKLQKLFFQPV